MLDRLYIQILGYHMTSPTNSKLKDYQSGLVFLFYEVLEQLKTCVFFLQILISKGFFIFVIVYA